MNHVQSSNFKKICIQICLKHSSASYLKQEIFHKIGKQYKQQL